MAKPVNPRQTAAALHDLELAARAAAGGRSDFGELVRRHGPAVRALLRRMGADPATADDLAQDAFMAAFERIAEFRGEGAFAGWVKRIAARLYIRRHRRRGGLDFAEPLDESQGDGGRSEGASMDRMDLDAALAGLTASERLCVSLCCGAGLSHAEAAESLNAPLGTVKSHVKRGMDKLRRRMGAVGPGAAGAQKAEDAAHG